MDDQRLDEILDRANAATKGPWCTDAWEIYQGTEYVPGISFWIGETCRGTADLEQDSADASFIAAARTDVPELVAEVVALRARVAELEAYAYGCDAEGCIQPHSSWCDVAQKSAVENNGCTCGETLPHAMHCWKVTPPRTEVEEMRRALAERSPSRQAEDPHDGPNHHDYTLGRDLPFIPNQQDRRAP
ncbi:hypothetical protein OG814_33150 [Streptomyces zaomyceticus]|uniref:Uncharacterized protein n=1 Tax=Streptomyces zaomyceticus TaxID=68286 RepID=A0ABZ1LIE5_9ACTN